MIFCLKTEPEGSNERRLDEFTKDKSLVLNDHLSLALDDEGLVD